MNIMKVLAWFEIIGCLGIGIFLIVYPLASGDSPPSVGIYLRGIAVAVFGLIWGLLTLRKEALREYQTKIEKECLENLEREEAELLGRKDIE